ncbi:MAG: hypothetical protein OXB84_06225 [Halobacteriovoraceae bacterium]|nr:hypothetical protein [Halobacteriovoraceae bacterium]
MTFANQEFIQLLNTAIIKTKERKMDSSYQDRLTRICQTPAIEALGKAVANLAEKERISRDQAAIQIVEAVRGLTAVWDDYIFMEGIDKLKGLLKAQDI